MLDMTTLVPFKSLMNSSEQIEAVTHLLAVMNELDSQMTAGPLRPGDYTLAKAFLENKTLPYSEEDQAEVIRLIDKVCEAIWEVGREGSMNPTITECDPYMLARKFCSGKRQHVECECGQTYTGHDAEDMYAAHHAMTGH